MSRRNTNVLKNGAIEATMDKTDWKKSAMITICARCNTHNVLRNHLKHVNHKKNTDGITTITFSLATKHEVLGRSYRKYIVPVKLISSE